MSTCRLQKILLVALLGAGLSGFCVYKVVTDQRTLSFLADLPPFRSPSRILCVDAPVHLERAGRPKRPRACRDHALTGKHKDSMHKVKLQPAEIACLILSVMVITFIGQGQVQWGYLGKKYSQLACV